MTFARAWRAGRLLARPMALVTIVGLLGCAIGAIALLGWLTGSIDFVRIRSDLFPMPFNAAVGYLVLGAALALAGTGRYRVALIVGLLASALGLAVLAEHVTGTNLGIDELLWQDRLTGLPEPRGRIPVLGSTAFALAGMLVAAWAISAQRDRRWRWLPPVLSTTGSLFIAAGLVGFLVQLVGMPAAFTGPTITRISVLGALDIALVGAALALLQLTSASPPAGDGIPGPGAGDARGVVAGVLDRQLTAPWTPLPIASATFVATLLLWHAVTSALRARGQPIDESVASQAAFVVALAIAAVLTVAIRNWLVLAAVTRRLREEVAERQWTEEALRASDEQLRVVAEHTPDLVARLDRNLRILYLNRNPEGRVGRHVGGMIREAVADPGAAEHLLTTLDGQLRLALETGAAAAADVTLRVREDTRSYEIRIVPEVGESGSVRGLIVIARDVTDRRLADEERRRLEAQVLHSQKLEGLGVLAGGIAHDFNNMLVAILGNAGLVRRQLAPGSPGREEIDDIEAAAQRAAELARQMLAYSGRGRFVVEPVDLSRLVAEMAHLLEASVARKAVIVREFARDLPRIIADPTQIRQVVMNLVTNASDALDDSGGSLTIRTGCISADRGYLSRVEFGEKMEPGAYVFVEVSDDGHGMDAATIRRIFDPFFSTKQTGRGLGLAAVLGIVRGHGGGIMVYSEPGRGSRFRILFPASGEPRDEAGAPPERPPADAIARVERGTVLVVDDEQSIRETATRILESVGFHVMSAADGDSALELCGTHAAHIDVVLLDLTMPGRSGDETFRRLHERHPGVRVVMTSGYSEHATMTRFADMGLSGFIEKPYRAEQLVAVIRGAIGGQVGPERETAGLVGPAGSARPAEPATPA